MYGFKGGELLRLLNDGNKDPDTSTGGDDVPDLRGEASGEAAGPAATASVAVTNSPITVAQTLSLAPSFIFAGWRGRRGVEGIVGGDRREWERTAQMVEQQAAILEQILGRLHDMEARERSRKVRESSEEEQEGGSSSSHSH